MKDCPIIPCVGGNIKVDMNGCNKHIIPTSIYKTKILRPNILCGYNVLNQCMINEENTKYIIKYNYNLLSETITVPNNSILEFDGGSLKNGTIVGQDTKVINVSDVNIFHDDIITKGTWIYITMTKDEIAETLENKVDKSDVYVKDEIRKLLDKKQNSLKFEDYPVAGSINPVKSLGIVNAIKAEANERERSSDIINDNIAGINNKITTEYYNKEEVNNIISRTPETDVVVVNVEEGSTIEDALNTIPVEERNNKLFRVPGPNSNSFTEWGWDGTSWVKLADKDYYIDNIPYQGSNNAIESNKVYDLEQQLSILGGKQVDFSRAKVYNACIETEGLTWSDSNGFSCYIINVENLANKTIKVKNNVGILYIAQLIDGSPQIGYPANFSGEPKLIASNVLTIRPDTKYLYILKTRAVADGEDIEIVDTEVTDIIDMDAYYNSLREKLLNGVVNIEELTGCGFVIEAPDRYQYIQSPRYDAFIIPVMDYKGGVCRLEPNVTEGAYFTFIKSLPRNNHDVVDYSEGSIYTYMNYSIYDLQIPYDANYIFIVKQLSDEDYTPVSIQLFRPKNDINLLNNIKLKKEGSLEEFGNLIGNSYQSMALYGDYGVFLYTYDNTLDHIKATIYNIKTFERVCSVTLPYSFENFGLCHCNTSSFSRQFYDDNEDFPLLYISQWEDKKGVLAYDIKFNETKTEATAQLIQVIEPNDELTNSHIFGKGVGDFVIDYSNNMLIHVGYKANSIASVRNVISVFSLPDVYYEDDVVLINDSEVRKVTLTLNHVIEWFDINPMRGFQDKTIINGLLFCGYGFSKKDRESRPDLPPLTIRVIDIYNHKSKNIIVEEKNKIKELESIDVHDGKLLMLGFHEESEFNKIMYSVNV